MNVMIIFSRNCIEHDLCSSIKQFVHKLLKTQIKYTPTVQYLNLHSMLANSFKDKSHNRRSIKIVQKSVGARIE